MATEKFYITTAISYPNGKPHIGHAYEMIATDAIARFQRLDGKDVYFLTGTDEHGIKMLQTARKEGIAPRQLADRNSAEFRRLTEALNISNDDFIRTTEERHYAASQAIWKQWHRMTISIRADMPDGIRCAMKPITVRKKPSCAMMVCATDHKEHRRMGRGRELFLPTFKLWRSSAQTLRRTA
jgi:methionyl-tRNA synthetase